MFVHTNADRAMRGVRSEERGTRGENLIFLLLAPLPSLLARPRTPVCGGLGGHASGMVSLSDGQTGRADSEPSERPIVRTGEQANVRMPPTRTQPQRAVVVSPMSSVFSSPI